MKIWQKNRNYRKLHQADGNVKNIIAVDGVDVEVTDEVYKAYSQMDRQERYQEEQKKRILHVSLEKLIDADVPIDLYMSDHAMSAEDVLIAEFDHTERERLLGNVSEAIGKLPTSGRELIYAIYFDSLSAREYARRKGVYPRTIMYRLEKAQERLKNYICANQ